MVIGIPLERLCETSSGINLFMNAEKLDRRKKPEAIILFEGATEHLEQELVILPLGSSQRQAMLEMLKTAFRKLAVESFLPDRFQRVELPMPWSYYIKKYSEVTDKLEGKAMYYSDFTTH